MTIRRWAQGEDDDRIGPCEEAHAAELEALGYTPLTPPGILRSAAVRILAMAETYDRTQNAAALPGLDRRLAEAMNEARAAVEQSALDDPDKEEEVDDFTRERQKRRPPPAAPPAAEG